MKVGIVDYEGGNLASVARAVEVLGYEPLITSDRDQLCSSDRVVFPGVGAAGAAMEALEKANLITCLTQDLEEAEVPCLGICIGIQLLFEHSEEDDQETLGIFKGSVNRFPANAGISVPHIGWNTVRFDPSTDLPFLKGVGAEEYVYFVNSFHVESDDPNVILGSTTYGPVTFPSCVKGRNWTATQFHLEKSGPVGLRMLKNFLEG